MKEKTRSWSWGRLRSRAEIQSADAPHYRRLLLKRNDEDSALLSGEPLPQVDEFSLRG